MIDYVIYVIWWLCYDICYFLWKCPALKMMIRDSCLQTQPPSSSQTTHPPTPPAPPSLPAAALVRIKRARKPWRMRFVWAVIMHEESGGGGRERGWGGHCTALVQWTMDTRLSIYHYRARAKIGTNLLPASSFLLPTALPCPLVQLVFYFLCF